MKLWKYFAFTGGFLFFMTILTFVTRALGLIQWLYELSYYIDAWFSLGVVTLLISVLAFVFERVMEK